MRSVRTFSILLALIWLAPAEVRAVQESLGDKIKKIFDVTPTPTPRKHRKKHSSPTPTPSPRKKTSPTPTATATPSPSPTETPTPSASPKKHKKSSPTATPTGSPTASAPQNSPTPAPPPPASAAPSPSASAKKKGAPMTIASSEIADYENYSPPVKKILDLALDLAGRGLNYKYGSADPASGGMDCSGFVYYVLTQSGLTDVPRDSSQQYVWLRKSWKFLPVLSRHDDTFELDALTPGDLLFWTGTYNIDRDPPITHAMIYLGREKSTGRRIMIGASDGRLYRGESRYGVSVFDFKISPPAKTEEGKLTPTFVGYGHVPGLH